MSLVLQLVGYLTEMLESSSAKIYCTPSQINLSEILLDRDLE